MNYKKEQSAIAVYKLTNNKIISKEYIKVKKKCEYSSCLKIFNTTYITIDYKIIYF